jgi:hypothetical protein
MANFRAFRRFWALTTLVVMVQLIVAQAMAASGALHQHFHDHDHDEGHHHECVVTLMLHGGYNEVVPDIVPVEIKSEPPQLPVPAPKASDVEPFHLVGGVLAHAPPRGP